MTIGYKGIVTQCKGYLAQIPGTEEMMSIPGVNWVTVTGFLAEVGYISP